MRLTFVIPAISSGGAEHAMTIMANYWAAQHHDVTILNYQDSSQDPFYELDNRIHHVQLGLASESTNALQAVSKNLQRLKALRAAIRDSRPDAVISFIDQTNALTLIATIGLKVPVFVSEQGDPNSFPIKPVWAWLRKVTYGRASRIVVVSQADANYFPPRLRARVSVVPNPFVPPGTNGLPGGNGTEPMSLKQPAIVSLGRLHKVKGYDTLLEAFSLLADRHSDWNLTVFGEGEERKPLEDLSRSLGLEKRVSFPGAVKHPYQLLRQAKLFVLPSRTEGFPLALCEAMASGLPVICTDCGGGVRDIIEDGANGILVPKDNPQSLAAAMETLINSQSERDRLATRAVEIIDRLSLNKVMRSWETLLGEELGNK